MRNVSILLIVTAAAVLLVGCGKKVEAPCRLSVVKVKSINLEEDQGNFARDAVAHELFARGAKSDPGGMTLKGRVLHEDGRLVAMNFAADSGNIAAAASLVSGIKKDAPYIEEKELNFFQPAAEAIAKKAVEQVCECVHGLPYR